MTRRSSRLNQSLSLVALAALPLLASCVLPKMQVKPGLAGGEQVPFEKPILQSRVRFGSFQVPQVDRSPLESTGASLGSSFLLPDWIKSLAGSTIHQDYSFRMSEEGRPPKVVRCRAEVTSSTADLGQMSVTSADQRLHCGVWLTPESPDVARLELVEGRGSVKVGMRNLAIEPVDLRGQPGGTSPAGFVLAEGGHDLGAVEVVNGGALWLAPGLDPDTRSLVAGSAAALLLYQPPSSH